MKRFLVLLLAALSLFCAVASAEETDVPALCELAQRHGFSLGACLGVSRMQDKAYLELLKKHFNSITCENEMKAYTLLSQRSCQRSADGMPVMDYLEADIMLRFAQENGIRVRGHVLVWDAYMPDWFFREGYNSANPFVDRDTMLLRMESYIEQVVLHFEQKFPGLVYCWDVVNEGIGDSAADWDGSDERHIRKTRGGERNLFYDVIGSDYIEYAFLYARKAVEKTGADIDLFYNDYNAYMPGKCQSICALVDSINSFATIDGEPYRLIDGVGMQGYIGGYGTQSGCMNFADLTAIRRAIEAYAAKGLYINVTELAVRNYENTPAMVERHASFYGDLFRVYASVNSGENAPLTNVTIWGAVNCDNLPESHYTYKLNSPYCGLFDRAYAPRPAFDAVVKALE